MSSPAGTPASAAMAPGSRGAFSIEPSPASTFGGSVNGEIDDDPPPSPKRVAPIVSSMGRFTLNEGGKTKLKAQSSFFNPRATDDVFGAESSFGSKAATRPDPHPSSSKLSRVNKIRDLDDWRSDSSSSRGSENSVDTPSTSRRKDKGKLPEYVTANESQASATSNLSQNSEGFDHIVQEYASDDGSCQHFESINQLIDPQAMYPPSSCVFVANLLSSMSDAALEVAVTQKFRAYGNVYVKIRRDVNGMPFAFCQYTNDENAEAAIRDGSSALIQGRPCRVERAKAHRLFHIERKFGPVCTELEAQHVLGAYGIITYKRRMLKVECAQFNLPDGILVQFQFWESGQSALQSLRNHEVYRLRSMSHIVDTRPSSENAARPMTKDSSPALREYMENYSLDRRSVHIGNLPRDVTEVQIEQFVRPCGPVDRVSLHYVESSAKKEDLYVFAFVDFRADQSAETCVHRFHGSGFGDKVIRVSHRNTASRERRRRTTPATPVVNTGSSATQQVVTPSTPAQPSMIQPPMGQPPMGPHTASVSPWGAQGGPVPFYWYPDPMSGYANSPYSYNFGWSPYGSTTGSVYNQAHSHSQAGGFPTATDPSLYGYPQSAPWVSPAPNTGHLQGAVLDAPPPSLPHYQGYNWGMPAVNAAQYQAGSTSASTSQPSSDATPSVAEDDDRSATPTPTIQSVFADVLRSEQH